MIFTFVTKQFGKVLLLMLMPLVCNAKLMQSNESMDIKMSLFSENSKIEDVISAKAFYDFGRLLFPTNKHYYSGDTLGQLSLVYYSKLSSKVTVEIVNTLYNQSVKGQTVFYDIYSEEEKRADPQKINTGLFFFKGNKHEKFAILNAGGAFAYVGAMQDSFPHALELSKLGYNAFALIYRPDPQKACEDLSRAINFIFENANELEVDTNDYSLWGGSAGARMVYWVGSYGTESFSKFKREKPAAIIMQYTGLSEYTKVTPPTFSCVGDSDYIASWSLMKARAEAMKSSGIDTEFHVYKGLSHGFGIGSNTVAYGWLNQAVAFWQRHMKERN